MPPRAIVRRLLTAVATLALITLIVFGLVHLAPGDPFADEGDAGPAAGMTAERRAELRALYHLDRPVLVQYVAWLADVARGDLGRSFHDRRPVAEKIRERVGVTLTLNLLALVVMVTAAVPIGAAAALRPGSRFDRLAGATTYALHAVPVFWAALLLQIALAVRLGWLPLAGLESDGAAALGWGARLFDRAAHLVLPVLCLSYGGVAYLSRFVRTTLLDTAAADALRAARARGLSRGAILLRHGFRQASVPMLTLAGLILPGLLGGSVIVEKVFAIPGLGLLFVDAMFQRDVPVVMALTLLSGVATLAGILIADASYALADPRVRRG